MASRSIIKDFNIIEYLCFSFFTCFEDVAAYFLLFQTAEEGLHGRIVIAITTAAHAGHEPVCFTETIPFVTAILRSLI